MAFPAMPAIAVRPLVQGSLGATEIDFNTASGCPSSRAKLHVATPKERDL